MPLEPGHWLPSPFQRKRFHRKLCGDAKDKVGAVNGQACVIPCRLPDELEGHRFLIPYRNKTGVPGHACLFLVLNLTGQLDNVPAAKSTERLSGF
jgi:hypothetical protein